MSVSRARFASAILEKLGAPLVGAACAVAARQNEPDDEAAPRRAAGRVAELLGKSVQLGIRLASGMGLREGGEDDSVRLALTALAAGLVADQYGQTGRVPGDADLRRLSTGIEAVLTFSDSFAPAADGIARLDAAGGASPFPGDESQTALWYVAALAPVTAAVAAFPFGRPEKMLAQDIAGRLVARAAVMAAALGGGGDDRARKRAELALLAPLARIYVDCHREQTARLMAMDDKARAAPAQGGGGVLPMDAVWDAFETRAEMAQALAIAAAAQGGRGAGGGDPAPPSFAAPPASSPPVSSSSVVPPDPPSGPAAAENPEPTPSGGNPMSFFKPGAKKPADGEGEKS